ncbi:MAG TPA: pirin-like C-terminal cupin domain-containing protein, partial [Cyclobacteriaceae bacterium]|nr:pirin-like C-terminal cupin domain-containing protein [Cyclobacteriaceae bacterium]
QWMNAGMGIIHSERPPMDIHDLGGRQEIIQLWINTPARHKMDPPAYHAVGAGEVPTSFSQDGKVEVRIFSGEVLGKRGPIPSQTEVNAATLYFQKGGTIAMPVVPGHNLFIYLLSGKVKVVGFGMVEELNLVHFRNDGEGISIEALEDACALFLSGQPLNEAVVSHGPFVINTETQVLEAMRDYQMGKMGVLIEG